MAARKGIEPGHVSQKYCFQFWPSDQLKPESSCVSAASWKDLTRIGRTAAARCLSRSAFYNKSGDLVAQKSFEAHGESAGWNGTLESSTFTHPRETFSAPLDASRLWVILSSAGGPTTVGIYIVDNVIVSRLSASNGPPEVLLRSPLPQELAKISSLNQAP
jgi:hypothetical protein